MADFVYDVTDRLREMRPMGRKGSKKPDICVRTYVLTANPAIMFPSLRRPNPKTSLVAVAVVVSIFICILSIIA